jgi:hypothetical protein
MLSCLGTQLHGTRSAIDFENGTLSAFCKNKNGSFTVQHVGRKAMSKSSYC